MGEAVVKSSGGQKLLMLMDLHDVTTMVAIAVGRLLLGKTAFHYDSVYEGHGGVCIRVVLYP